MGEVWMLARSLFDLILGDESLTRGLRDSEARLLIEWLVEQAEGLDRRSRDKSALVPQVRRMCQRARSVGRFIDLWFNQTSRASACQLWAAERFGWPMPDSEEEPYEALEAILAWEGEHHEAAPQAA